MRRGTSFEVSKEVYDRAKANIKPKKYVDRGKKYLDVTEVFGL